MTPDEARKASALWKRRAEVREKKAQVKKMAERSAEQKKALKLAKANWAVVILKRIKAATRCGVTSISITFYDRDEAHALAKVTSNKGFKCIVREYRSEEYADTWSMDISW